MFVSKTPSFVLAAMLILAALQSSRAVPITTLNSPSNDTFLAWPATITLDAYVDDFDANILKVDFYTNGTLFVTVTNDTMANPFEATYTWTNASPGLYAISAVASSDDGTTNGTDPASVLVYTNTGSITVSVTGAPSSVDFSTNAVADWAEWGLYWPKTYDHKFGVDSQISDWSYVSDEYSHPVYQNSSAPVSFTWTNGTPVRGVTNAATGAYTFDNGFDFTVAAGSTTRTLKIYGSSYFFAPALRFFMSDGSSAPVTYTGSSHGPTVTSMVFTVTFRGSATNHQLHVRYGLAVPANYVGYVQLQAATLSVSNLPPQVAITNLQSGTVMTFPTNILIAAQASDPDGSIARVQFQDGATIVGAVTSPPYAFNWTNVPAGLHKFTARAIDNHGAAFTSQPIEVFVNRGGGALQGSLATLPSSVDLTAAGRTDWGHWGDAGATNFNHRAGVTARIGNAGFIGTGPVEALNNFPTTFSWSDGTVTNADSCRAGILIYGLTNGFQFSVPADTLLRRLTVYLSAYAARGQLEATLSDASAPAYTDTSLSSALGSSYGSYTLDYAAASAGQTLTIRFTSEAAYDMEYGNVTLEAATLVMLDTKLRSPGTSGSNFQFLFPGDDQRSYTVEYTDLISPPGWNVLTNSNGNGDLTAVNDPKSQSRRFYRVHSN